MKYLIPLSFCAAAFLPACDEKKPQVVEKPTPGLVNVETSRLGTTIDAYVRAPSAAQAAEVDRSFADLDGEIAELEQRVATASGTDSAEARTKAGTLSAYRDKERIRYTEAQARAKAEAAKESASEAGEKVEDAAHRVGDGVRDAGEAVKDGVERAVDQVKEKLP